MKTVVVVIGLLLTLSACSTATPKATSQASPQTTECREGTNPEGGACVARKPAGDRLMRIVK